MWQRKQTIFLVVVISCMALSIFFPVWKSISSETTRVLFPVHYSVMLTDGLTEDTIYFPYCVVAVLAIASSTLASIEIGRFKNRILQLKLGALNSLFMAACVGLALYFANDLSEASNADSQYGLAIILPLVAMLSNVIANRLIRRDEKMVRNANRMR